MIKFLLTGGAGFIGHHLTRELLSLGYQVTVVDNLSTGKIENIQEYQANSKYRFIQGLAQDEALMEPLVEDADVIYNLAASVGVQKVFKDPVDCIENNISVGANILKLANKYKKRVFIFSTSEVYGKASKFPFEENDDIVMGPYNSLRWSYASSKVLDDYLARAYFQQYHLPVTIIRLFNTIGSGQVGSYGMVVPRFMKQAMQNEEITIFGTGKQSRCFTDVRDVVQILIRMIDNKKSHGELINIGATRETKIIDLAEIIKQMTNSRSQIKYMTHEEAYGPAFEDMDRRVPSIAKLKNITGYEMKYDLMDTLRWIYKEMQEKDRAYFEGATDLVAL